MLTWGKALELARRLDYAETFRLAVVVWLDFVTALQHGAEGLRLAEKLAKRSRTGLRTSTLSTAFEVTSYSFLIWGQRGRAEEMWREQDELAQRTGQATILMYTLLGNAIKATLDGRLQDAVATGQSISIRGDELGISGAVDQFSSFASMRPLLYLGKGDDALELFRMPHIKALCLAHLGPDTEGQAILEQLVLARPGIGSDEDEDEASTQRDIPLLEAAVLVRHREAAGLLLRRFAGTEMRTNGRYITYITRHLGAAAALLSRSDEARGYYQTALEVCREMPFRPEKALTHLQLAELLLDPSSAGGRSGQGKDQERAEHLEHLDTAIAEFRDMKMRPFLERAMRHREILSA